MTNGIAQKELPERICPRQHIERFVGVKACKGRGGHISDRVSTRLAKGDVAGFELRPKLWTVLQLHVVDLNVLSRGQVVLSRAVFVADIEDGPELLKGQQAHGHLDADHLHTWLPLSVDTSGQPEAAEAFLIDLALLEQEDSAVQVKNVPLNNGVVDFIDERKHVECWVVSQKKKASGMGGLGRV